MLHTLTLASDRRGPASRPDWGPHAAYDPDAHWDASDERPDDN